MSRKQVELSVQPINTECNDLVPAYAHPGEDAGFDFKSRVDTTVAPGEVKLIPTGIKTALPLGFEIQVRPRSGLALKLGIAVLNSPGTIDAGYRNELGIILYNTGSNEFVIKRGDRVAQGVVNELPEVTIVNVGAGGVLPESARGEHGFGSSGV